MTVDHPLHAGHGPDGPARRDVAQACRGIIDELATSSADKDTFAAAAALVEQAHRLLAAGPHGRSYEAGEGSVTTADERMFIDFSPVAGILNPIAAPVRIIFGEGEILGEATYGTAYEGPPSCVHGGYIAAGFDEVLGFAQGLSGGMGMTARLTINYRSPSPLHQPLHYRGWVDRVEGRKIFVLGELRTADGRLCAEAEGLFVSIQGDKWKTLIDRRAD